jgi:phospholipid transport system substrate-binding protein
MDMYSTRRPLLCAIGSAVLAAVPLVDTRGEAGPSWASTYIRRVGDELAAIMATAGSSDARRQRLQPFLDRVVDIDGVARFCLGRFWQQATPVQQQEYLRLFRGALTNAVLGRVGDYEHNEVRVVIERPETRDGNILVSTVVERTGTPPARVTWAISGDANNPRIVDVLAEGVSLRLTMRADYNAYLIRHGDSIVALIDALREQACDGCVMTTRPGPR